MLNSFVIGRCMVIMPKWDATEALRLIEKEKITYFVGVPTMSLELMNHPDRDKYDLSSLTRHHRRRRAAAGQPRRAAASRNFPNAQPALGYGLTETNAAGCANFWSNYAAKPASTGRAQKPLVEVAILGAGDRHLPAGEVGEIAIRTRGQHQRLLAQPGSDRGGVHRRRLSSAPATSAISTRTAICSSSTARRKSSSAAARISPRPRSRPNATPARRSPKRRCSARPTSGSAKCRSRSSTSRTASDSSEDELRSFLDGRLAKFKIPERIIFSAEPLPRLGTGKIDRRALKAQYAH